MFKHGRLPVLAHLQQSIVLKHMAIFKREYSDLILGEKISMVGIVKLWKGLPRKTVGSLLSEVFETQLNKAQRDLLTASWTRSPGHLEVIPRWHYFKILCLTSNYISIYGFFEFLNLNIILALTLTLIVSLLRTKFFHKMDRY